MSAKYLKVHIKPTNDEGLKKLKLFLKHVKDKNYEGIKEMDADQDIDWPEHYLDFTIKSKVTAGTVFMEFDTFTGFETEGLIKFLLKNGAEKVEAEVENTQVGEFEYYCNTDYADDYGELTWELLPEPYHINIAEKRIAVLGTPHKRTEKAIKEADEDYEAVIEGAITKDTNLVVSCEGAAATEIAKAQDHGIRIITEKHFRDLV